jgi:hypothetical protein
LVDVGGVGEVTAAVVVGPATVAGVFVLGESNKARGGPAAAVATETETRARARRRRGGAGRGGESFMEEEMEKTARRKDKSKQTEDGGCVATIMYHRDIAQRGNMDSNRFLPAHYMY